MQSALFQFYLKLSSMGNLHYASIGWDNGLGSNRRQAIM